MISDPYQSQGFFVKNIDNIKNIKNKASKRAVCAGAVVVDGIPKYQNDGDKGVIPVDDFSKYAENVLRGHGSHQGPLRCFPDGHPVPTTNKKKIFQDVMGCLA